MNLLNNTTTLLAFVRSIETGSFSAAARALGLTPSSVSKSITRLEAELRAKLFHRSTRHLQPTEEGLALFERVAPLLRGLEDAADAIRTDGDARGLLRVSMPGEIGRLLQNSLTTRFLDAHPGLRLDLSLSDRHVDVIREGYDVAFRIGYPADSDLTAHPIATLAMALVASPALLSRCGMPVTPEDLRNLPMLRYLFESRSAAITFADGTSMQPNGRVGLDTGAALRAAALAGVGVAHLTRCSVQHDLDCGALVQVLPSRRLQDLPLQTIHAFGRLMPARVRLLTDFVTAEMRQLLSV
ncbi:LysR family transcriptional regulator [Stenotrophomonas maltophilia]|uniref:LysR family transcriptional regulator n=1 Tax=Stenotrophomonas maltophilia TaxID=40324 RepID=A0A1A6XR75_STEMA|nr:LysR family transcriptional regulator [Stenotrophomonas maltophilia]OBU66032.1 LysR family transcriptional regulator [Stenotrophomonas maltophilia]